MNIEKKNIWKFWVYVEHEENSEKVEYKLLICLRLDFIMGKYGLIISVQLVIQVTQPVFKTP